MVKRREGLRLEAYLCPAKVWTIGYGHTRTAKPGMKISREKAEELLDVDLIESEICVEREVKVPLPQGAYDALVSFVFNLGCPALRRSTLLRLLNKGRYYEAARQFPRWVYGGGEILPGLVTRRQEEMGLFLAGVATLTSPTPAPTPAPTPGAPAPAPENALKPLEVVVPTPQAGVTTDTRYKKSVTNAGLAVTGVGLLGVEASKLSEQFQPLVSYSATISTAFVALAVVGVVAGFYGRWRVYRDTGV